MQSRPARFCSRRNSQSRPGTGSSSEFLREGRRPSMSSWAQLNFCFRAQTTLPAKRLFWTVVEPCDGEMMKISTYNWHQQKGAAFQGFRGMEVPSHYGNYEQEYWALRKSVGVRDVSFFGKIQMSGKDRQRFLNGMLSNDVKMLAPGKGVWALFLDVKGHIQADMKVYAFPEYFFVILQHYLRDKLMSGLDRYIISEDVRMKDVTGEFALFYILGPQSESFLRSKGMES